MVADESCGDCEHGARGRRGQRKGGGRGPVPKEMTPTAWNIPSFIMRRLPPKDPRSSDGARAPCVTTVMMMTIMLISASVLAFASCCRQSQRLQKRDLRPEE